MGEAVTAPAQGPRLRQRLRQRVRQTRLVFGGAGLVAAAAAALGGSHGATAGPAQPVQLAPHRAVYEMTLDRATPGSGVNELAGRMVYEITGSACEGYTQNMRFVTRTAGSDGATRTNDLRTSSWEETGGKRLRFSTTQYQDDILAEASQGDAGRDGGEVKVDLAKPEKKVLRLDGKVYFPIQHSIALIEAGRADRRVLAAPIYDGSEKGEKIYETSAVIGRTMAPGAQKIAAAVKNGDKLDTLPSWPIAISYYEPGAEKRDAVPTYELGFRFYENGVSTGLRIDYGEFAIRGELKEIEFLEVSKCQP